MSTGADDAREPGCVPRGRSVPTPCASFPESFNPVGRVEKIGKKASFDVIATGFHTMAYNQTADLFFPFFPRSEKITEKIIPTQLVAAQRLAARANLFFPRAEKIKSAQVQSVK